MPLVEVIGTPILTSSLLSVGMLGIKTPTLASAISRGVVLWAQSRVVSTSDVGTLGTGKGFLPLVAPTFYPVLLANATSNGLIGIFTPIFLAGLNVGITAFLTNGVISTSHPTIGVGTAVASVSGPPSTPFFFQAFNERGITGEAGVRLAKVLGSSFDTVFSTLAFPVPILGAGSSSTGVGKGVGGISLLWA